MKALLYDTTPGGVLVQVHRDSPPDEEWNRLVGYLDERLEQLEGVLIIAVGDGGPSVSQRSTLNTVLKRMRPSTQVVMLTDSLVARGTLTAINWMTRRGGQTRVFKRQELEKGIEALHLSPARQREVRSLAAELLAQAQSATS